MMKSRFNSGFTMVEVLIAVLVLAIGLLGVAALQITSLSSGQEAYFRTQATAIAEDFASRIRANQSSARYSAEYQKEKGEATTTAGAYQNYLNLYAKTPITCTVAPATNQYCRADVTHGAGISCNAQEMVAFDVWESCKSAESLLPGGQISSVRVGNRLSIAVGWDAAPLTSGGTNAPIVNSQCAATFAMAANKDCVILEVIP